MNCIVETECYNSGYVQCKSGYTEMVVIAGQ